jgi:hypothetical protein
MRAAGSRRLMSILGRNETTQANAASANNGSAASKAGPNPRGRIRPLDSRFNMARILAEAKVSSAAFLVSAKRTKSNTRARFLPRSFSKASR